MGIPILIRLIAVGDLFLELGLIAASRFLLLADWLPTISYLQWPPHCCGEATFFLAEAAETSFSSI